MCLCYPRLEVAHRLDEVKVAFKISPSALSFELKLLKITGVGLKGNFLAFHVDFHSMLIANLVD